MLYSIFVLDLKLIKWESHEKPLTSEYGDVSREESFAAISN